MTADLLPAWLTSWHIYTALSLGGLAVTCIVLALGGQDVEDADPYDGCCAGPDPAAASSAACVTRAFLASVIVPSVHRHQPYPEVRHEGRPRGNYAAQ
jgi:hypothetical protein